MTTLEGAPGKAVLEVAQVEETPARAAGVTATDQPSSGADAQPFNLDIEEGDFLQLQQEDPLLQRAWEQASMPSEEGETRGTYGQSPRFEPPELDFGPWCEPEMEPCIEGELTPVQRKEVEQLLQPYPHVLTNRPGKTTLASHEIYTEPGKKVRNALRPLPRKLWEPVRQELQMMLQWGGSGGVSEQLAEPDSVGPKIGQNAAVLYRLPRGECHLPL
nr:uncharacterized protein LOC106732347 [Pelodiscus sinensis]|eukprot:XP_014431447.1 uncharacterized protein LOC106732347 [Pelodiscus sinensis]